MAPEESQWGLLSINSEFLSSTLHFLFLIYPIFTSVGPDPYSEYGSNLDPDLQHCPQTQLGALKFCFW